MKIRIVSDLHCDVNGTFEFGFNDLDDVDLTLIAGDIAGDYEIEQKFLYEKISNKKPVICVGGNHLGYEYLFLKDRRKNFLDGTKEYSIQKLTSNREHSNIHYLENKLIIIDNVLIFGGTMYTDFNLYNNSLLSQRVAERYMNDFRYVYTTKDLPNIRKVNPDDYIEWFNEFKKKLFFAVKVANHNNCDMIVLTHFAPSKKSISKKYNDFKELNPAYASDLSNYIRNHSCIKLWVHGHMHDSFDYNIKQCRVICEPYGYSREKDIKPKDYIGKIIDLN